MRNLPNYIPDANPWHLAGPPRWFQRQLWEFDASLAIVASKQGYFYRLAQRRPLQLPENIVNDVLKEQADTQLMAIYGLVPITTILATVNWGNPLFFEDLRRRAPWRMGGAEKYEQLVLAQDQKDLIDKAQQQDANLTDLSKDAWKYYNKQIGLRSSLFSYKSKNDKTPAGNYLLTANMKPYKPEVTTTWLDMER